MKTATLVMCLFAVLAVSFASPISPVSEVDASNVETAVKKSTEAAIDIKPVKAEEENKSEPTKKSTESAIEIKPVKAKEEKMGKALCWCLVLTCLLVPLAGASDWSILKLQTHDGLKISLKNYCESWRMNVELHNIREFQVVPEECIEYIGKYVTSTQYNVDSQRATEECLVYLSTSCNLKKDGLDAWIFDIDDTLLSTVSYFKDNLYGGRKVNVTSLEEWMKMGNAPALDHSLKLYNELKTRGVQILLVTSRKEYLRSTTIDNLVKVGYYGWTKIIFRDPASELVSVKKYKSDVRKQIVNDGYRIWGIVGNQYSSIEGIPSPKRTFKLPNPMYYVA